MTERVMEGAKCLEKRGKDGGNMRKGNGEMEEEGNRMSDERMTRSRRREKRKINAE